MFPFASGERYCSDSTIHGLSMLPQYNELGFNPLVPPKVPYTFQIRDFCPPEEAKEVKYAASFIAEIGNKAFSEEFCNKKIELQVNDVLMDGMWLGEFLTFMEGAVADPITSTIYTSEENIRHYVLQPERNPSRMGTLEVYMLIWKAYEKFLYMAAKYPPAHGKYLHPNYAIDVMWHAHLICPRTYVKEVRQWTGYLMDHEPWPACEKNDVTKSINNTDKLWKEEFGCEMDSEHLTRTQASSKVYGRFWAQKSCASV